jgi:hypothetical protein
MDCAEPSRALGLSLDGWESRPRRQLAHRALTHGVCPRCEGFTERTVQAASRPSAISALFGASLFVMLTRRGDTPERAAREGCRATSGVDFSRGGEASRGRYRVPEKAGFQIGSPSVLSRVRVTLSPRPSIPAWRTQGARSERAALSRIRFSFSASAFCGRRTALRSFVVRYVA